MSVPWGDGTGPPGGGRGGGRGGGGQRRRGAGPAGNCVCPNCGTVVPHQRGMPCSQTPCPNCGTPMVRQ